MILASAKASSEYTRIAINTDGSNTDLRLVPCHVANPLAQRLVRVPFHIERLVGGSSPAWFCGLPRLREPERQRRDRLVAVDIWARAGAQHVLPGRQIARAARLLGRVF